MKITKDKLNTLLRSGLNQQIKTRKQLASFLNLDPTSLTRWFAKHDRLGNPRYPVVPDRHVTKILNLFNIDASVLALDDEDFRRFCFDAALVNEKATNESDRKTKLRIDNVEKRKLSISDYQPKPNRKTLWILASIAGIAVLVWWSTYVSESGAPENLPQLTHLDDEPCWLGYSESLGSFNEVDDNDPCHYQKLLNNALFKLAQQNALPRSGNNTELIGTETEYLLFLNHKLERRRLITNANVYFQLGKREFDGLNFSKAISYLEIANQLLHQLESPPQKLNDMVSNLLLDTQIQLKN